MTTYTGYSAGQGGVIASGEAVAYTPEIWLPSIIRYRARMMAYSKYVEMIPFSGGKGDTIRMPYIGRLRARKKLPGQPVQFETRKEGEWKMVVDRQTYAAIAVDKKAQLFAEIDIAKAYTPEIAQALMEDIEYNLLAERATFISYNPTANHIVSSVPFAYSDFLAAYNELLLRNIRPEEMVLQVGPNHYTTMFTINEFVQSGVFNSGNIANIASGTVVGTIMGIPVILNQNIRTNSETGITLGGNDYEDTTTSEQVATPGMATSPFLPTQYGSDQDVFVLDDFLTAGYDSAIMTTRRAIALAMPVMPSLQRWFNADYQEERLYSDQYYDMKVKFPEEGIVISTDETGSI